MWGWWVVVNKVQNIFARTPQPAKRDTNRERELYQVNITYTVN